jgi:hypothetical protein
VWRESARYPAEVAAGAQAVPLMDRAGWHTTPSLDSRKTSHPIFLPPRAPRMELLVNSPPLSLTTIFGLPRSITSRSSSRTTRVPPQLLANAKISASSDAFDRNSPDERTPDQTNEVHRSHHRPLRAETATRIGFPMGTGALGFTLGPVLPPR